MTVGKPAQRSASPTHWLPKTALAPVACGTLSAVFPRRETLPQRCFTPALAPLPSAFSTYKVGDRSIAKVDRKVRQ
ncbi:hypothetical protein SD80_025480 [Scytonema tolypothrichoides VB-61278]|nr:hypothetical protein SD80_025480 [Scytonema tolypothrichoides VB-61278]